jgi:hypothetical protein
MKPQEFPDRILLNMHVFIRDILSPELKSILHVEYPQQSMHMHYNQQKEKHSFVDSSELPPIQCITE